MVSPLFYMPLGGGLHMLPPFLLNFKTVIVKKNFPRVLYIRRAQILKVA